MQEPLWSKKVENPDFVYSIFLKDSGNTKTQNMVMGTMNILTRSECRDSILGVRLASVVLFRLDGGVQNVKKSILINRLTQISTRNSAIIR